MREASTRSAFGSCKPFVRPAHSPGCRSTWGQSAFTAVRCGDFASAAAAIAEADAIGEATGAEVPRFHAIMLAAFRGREAEVRALIESERQEDSAAGRGSGLRAADWMLALLCNGLGRYQEAVAAAWDPRDNGPDELFVSGLDGDGAAGSCNQEREP